MRIAVLATLVTVAVGAQVAFAQQFEGYNVCRKCHLDQTEAWMKTPHAKSLESLAPKKKAAEKVKAKLDPEKDYSKDPACLQCHATGHGKPGGYTPDMPADDARFFSSVSCESCHGAGSLYRQEHGAAENLLKSKGEPTSREVLVKTRQNFDYEAACAGCHLNYEGSSFKAAAPPFNPFPPKVDPKYEFNYQKEVVRSSAGAGVHEHFKLKGIFKGEPVPAIRSEIQKDAKEIE
jgi:hypothetical protein